MRIRMKSPYKEILVGLGLGAVVAGSLWYRYTHPPETVPPYRIEAGESQEDAQPLTVEQLMYKEQIDGIVTSDSLQPAGNLYFFSMQTEEYGLKMFTVLGSPEELAELDDKINPGAIVTVNEKIGDLYEHSAHFIQLRDIANVIEAGPRRGV